MSSTTTVIDNLSINLVDFSAPATTAFPTLATPAVREPERTMTAGFALWRVRVEGFDQPFYIQLQCLMGFWFDGASIPRPLRSLISKSAIRPWGWGHDGLYRCLSCIDPVSTEPFGIPDAKGGLVGIDQWEPCVTFQHNNGVVFAQIIGKTAVEAEIIHHDPNCRTVQQKRNKRLLADGCMYSGLNDTHRAVIGRVRRYGVYAGVRAGGSGSFTPQMKGLNPQTFEERFLEMKTLTHSV